MNSEQWARRQTALADALLAAIHSRRVDLASLRETVRAFIIEDLQKRLVSTSLDHTLLSCVAADGVKELETEIRAAVGGAGSATHILERLDREVERGKQRYIRDRKRVKRLDKLLAGTRTGTTQLSEV